MYYIPLFDVSSSSSILDWWRTDLIFSVPSRHYESPLKLKNLTSYFKSNKYDLNRAVTSLWWHVHKHFDLDIIATQLSVLNWVTFSISNFAFMNTVEPNKIWSQMKLLKIQQSTHLITSLVFAAPWFCSSVWPVHNSGFWLFMILLIFSITWSERHIAVESSIFIVQLASKVSK